MVASIGYKLEQLSQIVRYHKATQVDLSETLHTSILDAALINLSMAMKSGLQNRLTKFCTVRNGMSKMLQNWFGAEFNRLCRTVQIRFGI